MGRGDVERSVGRQCLQHAYDCGAMGQSRRQQCDRQRSVFGWGIGKSGEQQTFTLVVIEPGISLTQHLRDARSGAERQHLRDRRHILPVRHQF